MAKKEAVNAKKAAAGARTGDAAQNERAEAGSDYDTAHELAVAGRLAEAETLCREILTSDPNHAEALHLLGGIAAKNGDAASAIEFFNRALAAKPDFAKARTNLGVLFLGLGEIKKALTHFERAIASAPGFAPAYASLGNALMKSGRLEDAAKALERAVELEPDNALAHNSLGVLLLREERESEAIARFEKAIELDPDLAMALVNLGNVLFSQGKLDEAEESMRRAVEIEPGFAQTHRNLGTLLKVMGRYEEAEESLNRALALNPDDTKTRYNHATVHKFVPGDPEIKKLKELLGRKGFSEDRRNPLLFALGKAHDDIGLYAEAFSYYRQANEERASWANFDVSRRRQKIMEIKRVFRGRHSSASEGSGHVEHVPIFVVGMSRSGKTLVESLLSQHNDVFGAGQRPEWFKAIKKVLEKHSLSASFPDCMDFLVDEQIREIGKIYMEEISKYSPESRFFVNTKPELYLYICLILQALPFAKIIYCHRDHLDNCLFIYFKRYPSGSSLGFDPIRRLCDLRSIASFYADYQELIAHCQQLYGDRILGVRYEDLVQKPTRTGAKIYEYCGLEYDPKAIRCTFRTDEIGHWKHYEPYLGPLRQALGGLAR